MLLALRGRKDRMWLRLTFCRRAGLSVRRQRIRLRFGFVAYFVDVPPELSTAQAMRVARSIERVSRDRVVWGLLALVFVIQIAYLLAFKAPEQRQVVGSGLRPERDDRPR